MTTPWPNIEIKITSLANKLWKAIQSECAGEIDSLIELLQGRLSAGVMQIVTRQQRGLFPTPQEISLDCSCPDGAMMCKHVAASLYGVAARLDEKPELLFLLRGLDPQDLISKVSAKDAVRQAKPPSGAAIGDAELADVFGIELDSGPAKPAASANPPPKQRQKGVRAAPLTPKAVRKSKTMPPTILPKPRGQRPNPSL